MDRNQNFLLNVDQPKFKGRLSYYRLSYCYIYLKDNVYQYKYKCLINFLVIFCASLPNSIFYQAGVSCFLINDHPAW